MLRIPKGSFVAIIGPVGSGKVHPSPFRTLPLYLVFLEFAPPSTHWRDASDKRPGKHALYQRGMFLIFIIGGLRRERGLRSPDSLDSKCNYSRQYNLWSRG